MTITREQVADLREGDVVTVVETCDGDEITTSGLVRRQDDGYLTLGALTLVRKDGEPAGWYHTLTVISRAPRPLYVNHPRTEPVAGDVVREEDPEGPTVWLMDSFGTWQSKESTCKPEHMAPVPLRLLVDGETGQVVQ